MIHGRTSYVDVFNPVYHQLLLIHHQCKRIHDLVVMDSSIPIRC